MYSWIIIGEWWTLLTACETLQTAATGNSSNVNTFHRGSKSDLLKVITLVNLNLKEPLLNIFHRKKRKKRN